MTTADAEFASDGRLPVERRKAVMLLHRRDEGLCWLCRTMVNIDLRHPHPASAQIDHLITRSGEGADVWGNVRLAHRQCNMERNSHSLERWPDRYTPLYFGARLNRGSYEFEHPERFLPLRTEEYKVLRLTVEKELERKQAALKTNKQKRAPLASSEGSHADLIEAIGRSTRMLAHIDLSISRLESRLFWATFEVPDEP